MRHRSKFSKKYFQGGNIVDYKSMFGYKRYSPFIEEKYLIIDSPDGRISMKDVDFPVLGIGENGEKIVMQPEREYVFKSRKILEIPLRKKRTKFSSGGLFSNVTSQSLSSRIENNRKSLANNNPFVSPVLKGNVTEDNADAVLDKYNKTQNTIGTIGAGIKSAGSVLNNFIPGAGLVGNVLGSFVEGIGSLSMKWLYGDKVKKAQDLKAYSIYANQMRKQEMDMKNALGYI